MDSRRLLKQQEMTQGYTYFPLEEPFVSSHPKLLANDKNALSCNAGTAFPDSPLEGMICVRIDENKTYSYRSGMWIEIYDYNDKPLKVSDFEKSNTWREEIIQVCEEVIGDN